MLHCCCQKIGFTIQKIGFVILESCKNDGRKMGVVFSFSIKFLTVSEFLVFHFFFESPPSNEIRESIVGSVGTR